MSIGVWKEKVAKFIGVGDRYGGSKTEYQELTERLLAIKGTFIVPELYSQSRSYCERSITNWIYKNVKPTNQAEFNKRLSEIWKYDVGIY